MRLSRSSYFSGCCGSRTPGVHPHGPDIYGESVSKVRTASQRIGESGETWFRVLCQESFLVPNKVEADYGFDFLCQQDLSNSFAGAGQVSGSLLGFSVRSTARPDGRIKLTRKDAECLLAAEFPVGLVLVHLKAADTRPPMYFRFLDHDVIVELTRFLDSGRQAVHFTPGSLRPAGEFREAAQLACAPGFVERSRVKAAEAISIPLVGDVQIKVSRTADDQATFVTALDLYKYFEQGSDAEQEALYLATFGAPEHRGERLADLALKAGLVSSLARLPKPYILAGFVMGEPASVQVQGPHTSVDLSMPRTANEHHGGYVHEAGFALTISTRTPYEGSYIHQMRALVDPRSDALLAEHPDLLRFLEVCTPESTFIFKGTAESVIEAEYFDGLGDCVNFACGLREARALVGWDSVVVKVKDMASEESRISMMWLAAAASAERHLLPRGLVLGEVDEADCNPLSGVVHVPVICNLSSATIITWFTGHGAVLHYDGEPRGFKVTGYSERMIEVRQKLPKQSIYPEALIGPATIVMKDGSIQQVEPSSLIPNDLTLQFELD